MIRCIDFKLYNNPSADWQDQYISRCGHYRSMLNNYTDLAKLFHPPSS
ncbi:hypothetical protein DSUL_140010 [Desulfovibrionales bacterium]